MSEFPMILYRYTAITLLLILTIPALGWAEDSDFSYRSPLSATLMGWEYQSRLAILDRTAGRDGIATDRGIFQRFTPGMEEDYDLNMFTYQFTPREDRRYYNSPNGVRTYAGNLDISNLAHQTEIRTQIELRPRHLISLQGVAQYDHQFERMYLDFRYEFNLGSNHFLGIYHNMSGQRQNLDAGLSYRLGNPGDGMMKVEYTFVNYANEFIFEDEQFSSRIADSTRVYENRPAFISGTFSTPEIAGVRAEAVIGYHTETNSEIRSTQLTDQGFKQTEKMYYAGGLVEYAGDYATVGAKYKRGYTDVGRDTLDHGSMMRGQYHSEQLSQKYGFYLLAGASDFEMESWVWYEEYHDRQQGNYFDFSETDSLDYRENRVMMRNRIKYTPPYRGLIAGLESLLEMRDVQSDRDKMRRISPSIRDMNARVTAIFGFRFHPRMSFLAGVGYDLVDEPHYQTLRDRFDNVFTRIEFRW